MKGAEVRGEDMMVAETMGEAQDLRAILGGRSPRRDD